MGASSTGPKSNHETNGQTPGRVNFQDVENNNNEPNLILNPLDLNFLTHTMMDEFDSNNNTINNNYMTVSLSPSSTTLTTTYNKLSQKQAFYQQQIQLGKEKTPKESPKKKVDVKSKKEKEKEKKEEKKKKKEKPKTPRPATGGGGGKGGRMDNQQEMMRRPRRKK